MVIVPVHCIIHVATSAVCHPQSRRSQFKWSSTESQPAAMCDTALQRMYSIRLRAWSLQMSLSLFLSLSYAGLLLHSQGWGDLWDLCIWSLSSRIDCCYKETPILKVSMLYDTGCVFRPSIMCLWWYLKQTQTVGFQQKWVPGGEVGGQKEMGGSRVDVDVAAVEAEVEVRKQELVAGMTVMISASNLDPRVLAGINS